MGGQRRVTGLRNNAHHQVSRELVRKYHTLGIVTLNVAGMIKASLQSKALSDVGMSNLLSRIRYKAHWCGTRIVEAGQWYPSSKTCSACGEYNGVLRREPSDFRGLRKLRKIAGDRFTNGVVIYDGETTVSFGDRLYAVPARHLWENSPLPGGTAPAAVR